MGEGHWSATAAPGGEWFGVRGQGCWFRRTEGQAFWLTGGVHQHYNAVGAEDGLLGFPTSNYDPATGIQQFDNGAIWWDGDEFRSGREPVGATPPPFEVSAPPPPPLG